MKWLGNGFWVGSQRGPLPGGSHLAAYCFPRDKMRYICILGQNFGGSVLENGEKISFQTANSKLVPLTANGHGYRCLVPALKNIGQRLRSILKVSEKTQLEYQSHADSIASGTPYKNESKLVC